MTDPPNHRFGPVLNTCQQHRNSWIVMRDPEDIAFCSGGGYATDPNSRGDH